MTDTQNILFTPDEIDRIKEEIRQEIKDISMSLRITSNMMHDELKLIPKIYERLSNMDDRLTTIEMLFNNISRGDNIIGE